MIHGNNRKYFESLYKQTKLYLAEQQSLIKQSSAFALKVKGDVGLQAPWYRALLATSNMVAVHSHEMLRWKSVTELLIDSITFVLKGPVTKAEQKKASSENTTTSPDHDREGGKHTGGGHLHATPRVTWFRMRGHTHKHACTQVRSFYFH